MSILPILEFPDPRLRTVASPVQEITRRTLQLIDDMLETMYQAPGIGLAATQVNVHERILVADVSETQTEPVVLINPSITVLDTVQQEYDEGCLSIPGFYETVKRPAHVRVTALDRNGAPLDFIPEGVLAVCVQHEVDHLDGKLFVDYISSLKRDRIRAKLEKQHRSQQHA